jgi:hypothetical protein
VSIDANFASRVRLAGYAGAAWVAFQLLMLAASSGDQAWEWRGLAMNVLPTVLFTVGTLAGWRPVAIAFGVYGVVRLLMALRVLIMLALGAVAASHEGLALESALVAVFASMWIMGGIAAYRMRKGA